MKVWILILIGLFSFILLIILFTFQPSDMINNITYTETKDKNISISNDNKIDIAFQKKSSLKQVQNKQPLSPQQTIHQQDVTVKLYGNFTTASSDFTLMRIDVGNEKRELSLPLPSSQSKFFIEISIDNKKIKIPQDILKNLDKNKILRLIIDPKTKEIKSLSIKDKPRPLLVPPSQSDLPNINYEEID